jgi:hypothetical protein
LDFIIVAVSRKKVFLLLSPSTHSLHVSAHAGHLQVNIIFEASYSNGSVVWVIFTYFIIYYK